MHTLYIKLLEWVLPIVLGPIVYYVAREVLNVSQRVDDLPPWAKRLAVTAISAVVTTAFGALHLTAPEACAQLAPAADAAANAAQTCINALGDKTVVQAVTAALTAMLVHALKKERPNE